MKRLYTLLIIGASLSAFAQNEDEEPVEGLHYKVEMQASLSRGDHEPLWLNANKYGLSSLDKSNGYLRASIERSRTQMGMGRRS